MSSNFILSDIGNGLHELPLVIARAGVAAAPSTEETGFPTLHEQADHQRLDAPMLDGVSGIHHHL